jgi:AcrR family transcriptional regulator
MVSRHAGVPIMGTRKTLLEAGDRMASGRDGLGGITVASLVREAGVDEAAFHEIFGDLDRYRRELLLYVMDVVRAEVLSAAANLTESGFDRMWCCVEAYLDANLRHPAMRKIAHEMRTDPDTIELLRKRSSGYAMVFKVELAAMGQTNPAAAARLSAAMIVEAAIAENEAGGHAQPEMRRALYAFLKGYCG